MKKNLLLIGPPGVGKGTQAELICQEFGNVHVATGDIFRSEIKAGTELGKLATKYISQGQLVPDDVVIDIIDKRLMQDDIVEHGFLLDGFPRTVDQAEALERALDNEGLRLDVVISLEAPNEIITERMLARGRKDDTRETILDRLQVFRNQTKPVLDFYADHGYLKVINADQTVEAVQSDIKELLAQLSSSNTTPRSPRSGKTGAFLPGPCGLFPSRSNLVRRGFLISMNSQSG